MVRGKVSAGRFCRRNEGTKVLMERTIVGGIGMTATTAISTCLPPTAFFASISDPWPHRLLVSCGCCGVRSGAPECLWHGCSFAGGLNESAKHNDPH
jgi:hypothetical protein